LRFFEKKSKKNGQILARRGGGVFWDTSILALDFTFFGGREGGYPPGGQNCPKFFEKMGVRNLGVLNPQKQVEIVPETEHFATDFKNEGSKTKSEKKQQKNGAKEAIFWRPKNDKNATTRVGGGSDRQKWGEKWAHGNLHVFSNLLRTRRIRPVFSVVNRT
jgi:hypothetical protein